MKYTVCLSILALTAAATAAKADDSASVQAMLDACYAGKRSCVIDLQGATKTLNKTLKINPELATIRNAIFECRMTSGTCLYVSQDGFPHLDNAAIHRLESITLKGNKSIDGITMNYNDNNTFVINATITLMSVSIQGFNHGITLGNNVWGVDMFNVLIGNGNTGIYTLPNPHNSGERSTFAGGTIYNNVVAGIDEESCWEFDFQGTSFDFNARQMILRGPTSFTGHIENRDTGKAEIVLGALVGVPAGSIYMSSGSTITVDGWDPKKPQQPCYVETSLPYNNIKTPATLYGFGGTKGAVCGPGKVVTWDGQPLQPK
ncbi:hypothetical protein [Acetobacter fallax]|uniref:Hyphally-regulated cell wall protein N-terminal domain-containing protein n=1 Tax=Acetobacter fallax TaxID=1737473 RepID=A0ABX0KBM4_9PROT|nr:hypothetical protein [Acetobacter fallax]NHO33188.1 hypothetical protein [Acetobacter fallax]NHO36762.1 hypothetical protein [Acetobacter fallax]